MLCAKITAEFLLDGRNFSGWEKKEGTNQVHFKAEKLDTLGGGDKGLGKDDDQPQALRPIDD